MSTPAEQLPDLGIRYLVGKFEGKLDAIHSLAATISAKQDDHEKRITALETKVVTTNRVAAAVATVVTGVLAGIIALWDRLVG